MRRLDWRVVGVLALAAVTLVLVGWLFVSDPAQPSTVATPQPTATATATDAPVVSLWIGDSYTAGTGAKTPQEGEACLTARALGWVCELDAQGGTGFVADGHVVSKQYAPLGDRLDATIAKHPDVDVVVIDAGRNDKGNRSAIKTAAEDYFDRVHQAWPDATLVVIAPFLLGHDEPPAGGWFVSFEKALAAKYDGVFVDPLGAGWVAGTKDLTISDGVHPSPKGHEYIAEHLAKALGQIE